MLNLDAWISLCRADLHSFMFLAESGINGSCGRSIVRFLRNQIPDSHSTSLAHIPTNRVCGVCAAPLVPSSSFSACYILDGGFSDWDESCVILMVGDLGHVLICLLLVGWNFGPCIINAIICIFCLVLES